MFFKTLTALIIAYLLIWGFQEAQERILSGKIQSVSEAPLATTTVSQNFTATTTKTAIKKETPATTTSVTKKVTIIIKNPLPSPPIVETSVPIFPPVSMEQPPADFESINTFARSALVNILCTAGGNDLAPASGSGIIVNSNGLILTNAHVAQFFLLKDFRQPNYIKCIIRTGSPAYPKYNAELVYISPTWVKNNKSLLKENLPMGTGVNDYAFIRITNAINGSSVGNLSYIEPSIEEVSELNEPVLLASYPAGFLGGISILENLNIVSAVTTIKEFLTFDNTSVDVISVPGTVVSQKGSSGGAVVDGNKKLIGIISTSSDGNTTSDRDLRAITTAYINRDLQDNTGVTLPHFIAQDNAAYAKNFQTNVAPALSKLIIDELNKQ